MKNFSFAFLFLLFTSTSFAAPKYGPNAVPLSKKTNLEYFKKNPAPDFWALMPYYLPQPTEKACSATNLTLLLNAARTATNLTSDDKVLTVEGFVKGYTDKEYEESMLSKDTFDRKNVSTKNIARLLIEATEKLKLKTPKTKVEIVEVDLTNPEKSRKKFFEMLKENEKSSDDFIMLSGFIQGTLTGDPEGGAHVATVGAYDAKKGLVLVMDPDREWYEPYWAPQDKVFDAVKDPKSDAIHPSWIYFRVR